MPSGRGKILNGLTELLYKPFLNVSSFLGLIGKFNTYSAQVKKLLTSVSAIALKKRLVRNVLYQKVVTRYLITIYFRPVKTLSDISPVTSPLWRERSDVFTMHPASCAIIDPAWLCVSACS